MLKPLGQLLILIVVYMALFIAGSVAFMHAPAAPQAAPQRGMLGELALMACIDTLLVATVVRTSRLSGWHLITMLAGVFYFVKTFTSTIEAAYFMPNVTRDLAPSLLLGTLPLTCGFIPLAVWLGGRAKHEPADVASGFAPWPMPRAELIAKLLFSSIVVYPLLFFSAGWYVAFRSAEVREFYGGTHADGFLPQMAWMLVHEPFTYPLEVLRGGLWVIAALLLLRSTRGVWSHGALLVASWFALIQNDVLLLPNPLMSAEIRAYHFVETASSNFVFGLGIGWLFSRSHGRAAPTAAFQ